MLAAMTSYQSGEAPSEDDGIAAVMILDTAVLKKVEGAVQNVARELYRKRKYSKLDIAHARNMVTPSCFGLFFISFDSRNERCVILKTSRETYGEQIVFEHINGIFLKSWNTVIKIIKVKSEDFSVHLKLT